MAFDVKAWLTDLGFSEAEQADLAAKFDESKVKKLEGGYLRQADYSRQMNELGKAKTELQTANDRLTQELAEWAEAKARDGEVSAKQQKALEKAQEQAFKAEQVARRIATEAGLDPDKVLEGAAVVTPKPPAEPPKFDTSGLVPKDAFGQALRSMMHLPAELMALAQEHQELTGKPLDTRAIVREVEARAGNRANTKSLDPRAIWEELHNIPETREAKAKEKYDADIKAAEQRGREAALSEASIPGQAPVIGRGPTSPVLHPGGQQRQSVLQRPQPGTTVQKAVAALRSGKHREGATATK